MRTLTLICAIFLAVLVVFGFPRTLQEYKLHNSNNFVTVVVEKLPDCSSGYKHKFIHINYNGSIHILRTSCKYVSGLYIGQKVEMLHKPETEIFLLKEEDVTFELISVILLTMGAVVCLIVSVKGNGTNSKVRTTSNFAKARLQ